MYVSGFVIPVPEGNKEAYRQMAAQAAEMFKKAGAAQHGDDKANASSSAQAS